MASGSSSPVVAPCVFHIVGIDLKLGSGDSLAGLGQYEVSIRLHGVGLLGALGDIDASGECGRRLVIEHMLEFLARATVGNHVVHSKQVLDMSTSIAQCQTMENGVAILPGERRPHTASNHWTIEGEHA